MVSYSPFYFYGVYCLSSAFSFLILLVWVLSLFLLMSLAKGLFILFIFSKNQLLVSFVFAIAFFVSVLLFSALIYMISLFLLTLVVFYYYYYSFCTWFRCEVRFFIQCFSYFLRLTCIAENFPLRTSFVAPHRFWVLVLLLSFVSGYFLISILISSVICWLFNNMLFIFHVFVFFKGFFFFFLLLVSNFTVLWSEKMIDVISIFINLLRLHLWPKVWSVLENILGAFEKKVYSPAFRGNVL